MFTCTACGRRFKNEQAAERAEYNGCPTCGCNDISFQPRHNPPTEGERWLESMSRAASRLGSDFLEHDFSMN